MVFNSYGRQNSTVNTNLTSGGQYTSERVYSISPFIPLNDNEYIIVTRCSNSGSATALGYTSVQYVQGGAYIRGLGAWAAYGVDYLIVSI